MVNTQYRSDVTNDTIELSAIKTKQVPLADNSSIRFVVVEQEKARARHLTETGAGIFDRPFATKLASEFFSAG